MLRLRQLDLSLCQFLIGVILFNSIQLIDSTQSYVNVSYTTVWGEYGTIVAGLANGTSGSSNDSLYSPRGITIVNDILYISDYGNRRVVMINIISSTVTGVFGSYGSNIDQFKAPYDVFNIGSFIYVLDSLNYRIQKWSLTGKNPSSYLTGDPNLRGFYMYIDEYNNLYISLYYEHKIVLFTAGSSVYQIIAGDGTSGSTSEKLNSPNGVFVDDSSDLYIADFGNHRIQLWDNGATFGKTIAGNGIAGNSLSQLTNPSTVLVDKYGYMYIADAGNSRILRWKLNDTAGVCIVACTGSAGIEINRLRTPASLAFDSNGSLYVSEYNNHRVHKFEVFHARNPTTIKSMEETSRLASTVRPSTVLATTKMSTSTIPFVLESTTKIQTSVPPSMSSIQITTSKLLTSSQMTSTFSPTTEQTTSALVTTTMISSSSSTTTTTTQKPSLASTSTLLVTTTKATYESTSNIVTSHQTTTESHSTSTTSYDMTMAKSSPVVSSSPSESMTVTLDAKGITESSQMMTKLGAALLSTALKHPSATLVPVISTTSTKTTAKFTSFLNTMVTEITTEVTGTSSAPAERYSSSPRNHPSETQRYTNQLSTKRSSDTSRLTTDKMLTTAEMTGVTSSNCSRAEITLWPYNPVIISPQEVRRSDDFSITSRLELHCVESLATIEQWTIEACNLSSCSTQTESEYSLGELYVPARTLAYGIYRLNFTVTMEADHQLVSTASTYVKIVPSSIIVRLVPFGSATITQGEQDILTLDPGTFSIDPNEINFTSTNWNYTYFYRIYAINRQPVPNQTWTTIDHLTNSWRYASNSSRSSLIIAPGSLTSNRTYQFKANLTNLVMPTTVYTGDLLVNIKANSSSSIGIRCIISNMCVSQEEFQLVNPTTQIALTSFCMRHCDTSLSQMMIQWDIFYGFLNQTTALIEWLPLANTSDYTDQWFFGTKSKNFTATKDLIVNYPQIQYWQFQVTYSDQSTSSSSSIRFIVNSSPQNGSCSVNPRNGTTSTLFTITCFNWFDLNGIKDYSFYSWTNDRSNLVMIGYTTLPTLAIRMPIGDVNSTQLNLVVHVRDIYDSMTESDMEPISVVADTESVNNLMTTIELDVNSTSNPFIHILYGGNQNDVCQWLISFSRILNNMARENLLKATTSHTPAVSISVSKLNEGPLVINNSSASVNLTALFEYNQQLNQLANIVDYLMIFINNLTITDINSIILQATTLVQLTSSTNQLTCSALVIVSTRCLQLASALSEISNLSTFENVQIAASQISQCLSNALTAVNIPLQERGSSLELDILRANALSVKRSRSTAQTNQVLLYQQQTFQLITIQYEQAKALLAAALNIHLNIEQSLLINTSSVIIFAQKVTANTISNRTILLNTNALIKFPSMLNFNPTSDTPVLLRCVLSPLAVADESGQASTNLSILLSISFLDENSDEIHVQTNSNQSIELWIPGDVNTLPPTMIFQNVSLIDINNTVNNRQFNLHFINITQSNANLSVSVHLEMRPLNRSLGYMLIYKFDSIPQLSSSVNRIDGWTLLCPADLTEDDLYTYFIDNQRTSQHQSVIFGIRELDIAELTVYCSNSPTSPPLTDESFHFSADYELRMYTSGCYYLDTKNNWQSDGLLVGPLTNYLRTQCFSTHLTTFAGGFLVLPAPINWNYVFSHADFARNRTIYLTLIIISCLYILFLIYARHADKKDASKFMINVLSDNQSMNENNYFYQLIFFTGARISAGTKSKVCFILKGSKNQTPAYLLSNSNYHILQRGSIDSFLISVPQSLGELRSIIVCHDNSSPSWFLKYIIVRDLQTMEKSYFICQKWLVSRSKNELAKRRLNVASEKEKHRLSFIFAKKSYYSIADGHLWFSVFSRPPSNPFTRVQRCTCCFVLLYTAMLFNILYYNRIEEFQNTESLHRLNFGPFYLSREQIGVGVFVNLLTFIPSLLLVQLFRRIRPRKSHYQVTPLAAALSKIRPPPTQRAKKKTSFTLPWWCLFLAYGLSFILVAVSIFFIIAHGIEFGDIQCQKWLTSLVSGFFASVLLSEPIKIVCWAILIAFLTRYRDEDEEAAGYLDENDDLNVNSVQM